MYLGTDQQLIVTLADSLAVTVRQQNMGSASLLRAVGEPVRIRLNDGAARFLVH